MGLGGVDEKDFLSMSYVMQLVVGSWLVGFVGYYGVLQQLKAAEDARVEAEKQELTIRAIIYFTNTIDREISDDTAMCASLMQKHSLLSNYTR